MVDEPSKYDPSAPFDALEVHLVASFGRNAEVSAHPLDVLRISDQVDVDQALQAACAGIPVWWAVFGHRTGWGLDMIADVRTRPEAEQLRTALERTLVQP